MGMADKELDRLREAVRQLILAHDRGAVLAWYIDRLRELLR